MIDTGTGMPLSEQNKLDIFLNNGIAQNISKGCAGFGFGLFISNEIVENLNSTKRINGGGIRFEFKDN